MEDPAKVNKRGEVDRPDKTNDDMGDSSSHMKPNNMGDAHVIHVTKYGSELLPGMKTYAKMA